MTDRGFWVGRTSFELNVRRLMYQSLIWSFDLRNDPRRLRAPLDTKNSKGLADPLVDRVGRYFELARDFFRGQVLVDEEQAIELSGSKLGNPLGHYVRCARVMSLTRCIVRSA